MTQTVLQRLLRYPHRAVFDTTPAPELALRLRNPTGLAWDVDGSKLRLVVGQNMVWDGAVEFSGLYDWGVTRREYDLLDKTIAELADELRADGHEVAYENPDLGSLGASALIVGSGDQGTSNGDHLNAFDARSCLGLLHGLRGSRRRGRAAGHAGPAPHGDPAGRGHVARPLGHAVRRASAAGRDRRGAAPAYPPTHHGFANAGGAAHYRYWALSASPEVADVEVDSPEPGRVRISVLAKEGVQPKAQPCLKRYSLPSVRSSCATTSGCSPTPSRWYPPN